MAREVSLPQGCKDFCYQEGSDQCTSDNKQGTSDNKQGKGLCHTPSIPLPDPSEIFSRNNARPAVLITSASLQATISKAQLTRWKMGSLYGYIWRDVSTALPFPQLLSGLKVNVIGCAIGENTDARTSSSCLEKCASL